jgi:hypothetical protein
MENASGYQPCAATCAIDPLDTRMRTSHRLESMVVFIRNNWSPSRGAPTSRGRRGIFVRQEIRRRPDLLFGPRAGYDVAVDRDVVTWREIHDGRLRSGADVISGGVTEAMMLPATATKPAVRPRCARRRHDRQHSKERFTRNRQTVPRATSDCRGGQSRARIARL